MLTWSTLGAANTLNAAKPFARQGPGSIPSFAAGWLTSELPLHAIAIQALSAAHHIRKGALRRPAGWLGLGLTAASWAGLWSIWREALSQGEVFEAALREGLGDDVSNRVPPPVAGPVAITGRRIASGPLRNWKRRYVSGPTFSYGDAGRRNELDIWRRRDLPKDGRAPVLLQVHGGGWVIGNKDQQAMPLMGHLADNGWVCVSINYRLSPRATWPDHIVDVKRALAWIKANIAEHGGDPEFVAITGGSAGGHLSSLAALSANDPMFQPGFEDADTSVAAAVPFYGVYDWTNRDGTGRADMERILAEFILKVPLEEDRDLWDRASSMSWIDETAPPFFVIHGTNDSLVPVEQARSFVRMLQDRSREPVAYAELPGAQHAFEVFDSPRTIRSAEAVRWFLEDIRRRRERTAAGGARLGPQERARVLTATRTATDPAVDVGGDGVIKGNRSSSKYHVPGSQWYDQTEADEWFVSVEDAIGAGYEPAGGPDRQVWPPGVDRGPDSTAG